MKKTSILLVPSVMLPYVVLFVLTTALLSESYEWAEKITDMLYLNNITVTLSSFVTIFLTSLICNILYTVLVACDKADLLFAAKSVMIAKFAVIPVYIAVTPILLFCLSGMISDDFVAFVFLLAELMAALISCVNIAVGKKAVKTGVIAYDDVMHLVFLQFFFYADIVCAALFYRKLKLNYSARSDGEIIKN